MARLARVVVEGVAHHIVQRGNRRQDVFFCDGDRLVSQDDLLPSMVGYSRQFVSQPDDEQDLHRLRKESSVGRPLGDEEFIIGLERKLGRMLRRRPPGRPGKSKDQQRRGK